MLSADLKTVLDDASVAAEALADLGTKDVSVAHRSLVSMANHGVPLDLLDAIVSELATQLPGKPDPDLGLKNFERFVVSSRSPMSLAALLVRDPSAMSALLDLFSFSPALSDLLIQDPESFDLIRLTDGQPVAKEVLLEELKAEIQSAAGLRAAKNRLRRFKQREIVRIAYGDLVRKFEIQRTSQQLGYLVESICDVALEYCLERVREKYGVVRDQKGQPAGIALIAHQRLGARGSDYSPLIAIHPIFDDSSELDGNQKLKLGDYYERLMDEFEDLLSEENEFGYCYQIRFERRPMSGVGRCCSVQDSIKFFDQNASAKDRLDLIQFCYLCGDPNIADRFLVARRQICFRNYFSPNDLAEIQSLKHGLQPRTEANKAFRNIKTSPGGLHDLEFTINFLQLLVGRKIPSLDEGDFFDKLFELERHEVLTRQEFSQIKDNYSFLRTVSHRLQLCQAEATDVLPRESSLANRLNRQLNQHFGVDGETAALERADKVAEENLAILAHLLQWEKYETDDPFKDFVLSAEPVNERVVEALQDLGFLKPELAVKSISLLASERHRFISSKRCRFYLASIVADLLKRISMTADPDETLTLLTNVSDSLGGKGTLWELFWSNKSCLQLYVDLCANTPYLASILQANPGMLDELMDFLTLRRLSSTAEMREELDLACGGSKDVLPIIISFRNAKHLQIGVAQLLGHCDDRQVHTALADVADCCIQKMASVEFALLKEKHGPPWNNHQDSECEFGIVVGGKIGAREPNYHSNALFWVLYDSDGKTAASRNQKQILNQQFFGFLATRVAKVLSQNGPQGRLYELEKLPGRFGDASTIALSNAELEAKCLKRIGSAEIFMFLSLCRVLSNSSDFAKNSEDLIARLVGQSKLTLDEWEAVWSRRVELEAGASRWNLKRAAGGTLDVETLIHFLFAAHSGRLQKQTHTVDMLEQLIEAGLIGKDQGQKLQNAYQQLKRIELYLRLMNLPRRHALPVPEIGNESGDGEITPNGTLNLQSASGKGDEESDNSTAEIQSLAVHQLRLTQLMDYDRFDALKEDVETYQLDNRELVESIVSHQKLNVPRA